MSDPDRLRDQPGLGATLLASAHDDAPSAAARRRAASALGLGVGASVLTGSLAAGAAQPAGIALWGKLAVGVGLIALAGGGGFLATRGSTPAPVAAPAPPAPTLSRSSASATLAGPDATPAAPLAVEPPSPSATLAVAPPLASAASTALPAETRAPGRPAPRASASPVATDAPGGRGHTGTAGAAASSWAAAPARPEPARSSVADRPGPPESALSRELRAIDAARSALDRGDAFASLASLDAYERAHPRGALKMEAAVLRAEALRAGGDANAARKLARELLVRDPAGPHAHRLQTIAGGP